MPWPGLSRPSTPSLVGVLPVSKTWMPGSSPGKACFWLHWMPLCWSALSVRLNRTAADQVRP
jgi:hypothetical protein